MFVPRRLIIKHYIGEMEANFCRVFGNQHHEHIQLLRWMAYMALEKMGMSDCLYHDLDHAIMATSVGQDILLGKCMRGEPVAPQDWLNYVAALLCFNLGYVRGVCQGDTVDQCATGIGDATIDLKRGATGAVLAAHVVDRSKSVVRRHFGNNSLVAVEAICESIEFTRFPPPEDAYYQDNAGYPGLTRAAHFIGAIADPDYMRRMNALFLEFQENGLGEQMGFSTAIEFREGYAQLFESMLAKRISVAVDYLRETREGNRWIANMNAHLHAELHQEIAMGLLRASTPDTITANRKSPRPCNGLKRR